jgi:hypothetical protein
VTVGGGSSTGTHHQSGGSTTPTRHHGGGSSTSTNTHNHQYTQIQNPSDLSQNNPAYGHNIKSAGCGIIAMTNSVRDLTYKLVSPDFVAELAEPEYSEMPPEYLNEAMPVIAHYYRLRYYKTTLAGAFTAVEHGDPAIVLATAGRYTHGESGHYFNLARARVRNGVKELEDFDSNQPGYGNNLSWNSITGYQAGGVYNEAWVLAPGNSTNS